MDSAFQQFLKARLRLARLGKVARAAAAVPEFPDFPSPEYFAEWAEFVAYVQTERTSSNIRGRIGGPRDYEFDYYLFERSSYWTARATGIFESPRTFTHSIPWQRVVSGPWAGYISIKGVDWDMPADYERTPESWRTHDSGEVFFQIEETAADGSEVRILWEGWIPFQVGTPTD